MARQSLFDRQEPFIAAGVLGAHGNTFFQGFRQYDVRFMIEIFSNWVASAEEHPVLIVQNNQVARYLNALVDEGFARTLARRKHPVYNLTPIGVLELISRIVQREHFNPREHFYFVYFFINGYRKRLIGFIKSEGTRFPYGLQMELENLLDPGILIERQIRLTQQKLRQLEERISENIQIRDRVDSWSDEGKDYFEIVHLIDKNFPFSFNTQRRFSEVFKMGTDKQGMWELKEGALQRIEDLWLPSKELLSKHLEVLQDLQQRHARESQREEPSE